ncbi:MAG: carboxymuconolactone decarboxylase family protein, partial [Mycobacteriales bacterium]
MSKPMRKLTLAYLRRRYRQTPEPMVRWADHGGVFWSWLLEESVANYTWKALPRNIFYLATLKAASVIDCPWCLDFGSMLASTEGLSADKLRDLHSWRASPAFDDDERLALAYAEQLSATPAVVEQTLVDQLRERFG